MLLLYDTLNTYYNMLPFWVLPIVFYFYLFFFLEEDVFFFFLRLRIRRSAIKRNHPVVLIVQI